MNKKVLSSLICVLLVASISGCNKSEKAQVSTTTQTTIKPVTIENVENKYYKITIDYNSGIGHKEMGQLLGKEIKARIPNFQKNADDYIKGALRGESVTSYISYSKLITKNLQKEYLDEIDGLSETVSDVDKDIAGDGKLSKNELYLLNCIADFNISPDACSAISVYGEDSVDGKNITGRNLDWVASESLKSLSAVTVIKQGDKSICSIGFVGYMGIISGFSKNKVFASILNSPYAMPYKYDNIRSYPFDIRYALENSNSLDSVGDFMTDSSHDYFRDHLIFLSDPNTGKVVENNLRASAMDKKRALRTGVSELNEGTVWGVKDSVACVNTFALKGNANAMASPSNSKRWESFKNLMTESTSPMDMNGVKKIMSYTNPSNNLPGRSSDGSIYNTGTVQSIIFKPSDFKLEVAFAPRGKALPVTPDYLSIPVDFN
jgi:hypothetical protein